MENIYTNMSLGQFIQVRDILKDGREVDEKMIAIGALLQGISEDDLLDMPIAKAREVFHVLDGLDQPPKAAKIRKKYQVGDWTLRLCDVQDTCVAQWIDYQQYARMGKEEHMTDILSVALVPEGKKYNEDYDIDQLKKDILEHMSVSDALAVCFFFQRKYLKSMKRILTYLLGWSQIKLKGKERKEITGKALKVRREVSDMLHSL